MSSADRWRTLLSSKSFRMRSRGPVASKPLVFKSWPLVTQDNLGERCPFPLSYSVLLPRKYPDRAANADFGVTVSHCGVRACAEPHALPDGNLAGELHHPVNGRAAQAWPD